MATEIRESEFIETGSGIYFLGRMDGYDTWFVQRRDLEGGRSAQNKKEREARVLWDACLYGPRCVECSAPLAFDRAYRGWEKREAAGLCLHCDHWIERVGVTNPDVAVIDGYRYTIRPVDPRTPSHCLGHGGASFTIRFNDGREVTTRNLWAGGRVPPHFSARIPNNATFVKTAEYSGYVGAGSANGARVGK